MHQFEGPFGFLLQAAISLRGLEELGRHSCKSVDSLQMTYSLNSLKRGMHRIIQGSIVRVINGDTRSVHYSSDCFAVGVLVHGFLVLTPSQLDGGHRHVLTLLCAWASPGGL